MPPPDQPRGQFEQKVGASIDSSDAGLASNSASNSAPDAGASSSKHRDPTAATAAALRAASGTFLSSTYAGRRATLWRTLQTFNVSRILIALLLLAFVVFGGFHGANPADALPYIQLCAVYLLASVAFFLLTLMSRERFLMQLSAQMAVDMVVILTLYIIAGGARSGLAILYLFPLAGGAILAPRLIALFFAAVVALVLLAESLLEAWRMVGDSAVSTAGLYGMAFFAAVLVLNQLASKLLRQEELAEQRGQDLRLQQAINRLIIADMGDGILVIDEETTIVTANPAAATMLGWRMPESYLERRLTDIAALLPIADAFFAWSESADGPRQNIVDAVGAAGEQASRFVMIKSRDNDPSIAGTSLSSMLLRSAGRYDRSIHLKVYFATVQTSGQNQDRTIIFLQDVTEIENKAQDLKLASMGRLTASIAHEVRNPLSAISYAASLLEEDVPTPTQTRLLRIIEENVTRLNRMIEDILKLSRKAQLDAAPLDLSVFLSEILIEFSATNRLADDLIQVSNLHCRTVRFDPLHLREVIVNLLSNAIRYASGKAGSIRCDVLIGLGNRTELHIRDDGPPMSADVRAHLFEPFYTTSSKGTGLGLYLARELCLNNDAMLDYEYRREVHDVADSTEPALHSAAPSLASTNANTDASGRFVITFAAMTPS